MGIFFNKKRNETPTSDSMLTTAIISSISAFFFNEETDKAEDLFKFAKKNKSPILGTLQDILTDLPSVTSFENSDLFRNIGEDVEMIRNEIMEIPIANEYIKMINEGIWGLYESIFTSTELVDQNLEDFFNNVTLGQEAVTETFFILDDIKSRFNPFFDNIENINKNIESGVLYDLINTRNELLSIITDAQDRTNKIIIELEHADKLKDFLTTLDKLNLDAKVEAMKKLFQIFDSSNSIANPKNITGSTQALMESIVKIAEMPISEDDIDKILNTVDALQELIEDGYMDLIKSLTKFDKKFRAMGNIRESIGKMNNVSKSIKTALGELPGTGMLLKSMIKIPMLIKVMAQLVKSVEYLGKMDKIAEKGFNGLYKGAEKINTIVDKLNEHDPKEIDRAIYTVKQLRNLIIISGIMLAGVGIILLFVNILDIILFTGTLLFFIYGLVKIAGVLIKSSGRIALVNKILPELSKFVAISGLILILGGLFMRIINTEDILKFTSILMLFLTVICFGLIRVIKSVEKDINDVIYIMKELNMMIMISGALLLYAGVLGAFLDFTSMITFVGMLTTLIFGVLGVYWFAGKFIKKSLYVSENFANLVFISGMTLMIGSLFTKFIKFTDMLQFTFMLLAFITGVTVPFVFFKAPINMAINVSENFLKLIGICGLTLALGSLITAMVPFASIITFSFMITLFVGSLCMVFGLFKLGIRVALSGAKEFGYLVMMCGLTLVLGGLFMQWINKKALWNFMFLLLVFVSSLVTVFGLFGKRLKKSLKYAKQLGILVIMSAATLIIGGLLFMLIPNLEKNVWNFIGAIMTLVGGMGAICLLLGVFKKYIKPGVILMAAIVGIILLSAVAISILAECTKKVDLGNLAIAAGIMLGIVVIMLGIVTAIGAVLSTGVGALIVVGAVALLGAIVGIFTMMTFAMEKLVNCVVIMKEMGDDEFDLTPLLGIINGAVELAEAMTKLAPYADTIMEVSDAADAIATVISKIAEGVKDYAALKIPIYTGTKKTGYRSLTSKDFTEAAQNITLIITTVGSAIIKTYEKNPEMFEIKGAFADLGFGRSKFDIVARSLKVLGPLITNIAQGIQNYANLKMPIYGAEGKITGYEHLTDQDFKNAATNISTIITLLSKTLIDTYEKNPEMFKIEGRFANLGFGKSKFDLVARSLKVLGPLISSIAEGIKDYSELKMPVYGEDGKIKEYKLLTNADFKTAALNISTIITLLSSTIIDVYDQNPQMFEATGALGWGDSKFDTVAKSLSVLGNLISNTANGIKDYAELRIPEKWKDGKAIEFRTLTHEDFKAAADNISLVITTLAQALINVYTANPDLFDDEEDSIFYTITNSIGKLGKMVADIAEGIKTYASCSFAIEWKDGKPTKFKTLGNKEFEEASRNIGLIVTTLANALIRIYTEHPEMFDDGKDSTFYVVSTAAKNIGEMVAGLADGVSKFATLQIPNEWDDKGNPKSYLQLEPKDFEDASKNIAAIVENIFEAFNKVYKDHKDMFSGTGFLGMGDSPVTKVIEASMNVGKIVADIADAMTKYATMMVPTEWNDKGTAIKYRKISNAELLLASLHIKEIIKNIYNAFADLVIILPKNTHDVKRVVDASLKMGEVISGISDGLIKMSSGKIADQWDKNGNPTHFVLLDAPTLTKASTNIKKIITNIAHTFIDIYKDPDAQGMFNSANTMNWKTGEISSEPTPFEKVVYGCSKMQEVISGIFETLINYAEFKIAKSWDKDGKPKEYYTAAEKDTVLKGAAETIKAVITNLGDAIITVYDKNPKIFAEWNGKSIFVKVIKACTKMGDMIYSIARGLSKYGNDTIPVDYMTGNTNNQITGIKNLAKKAADVVKEVVLAVGQSLVELYESDEGQKLFGRNLLNFGGMIDSPFERMMNVSKQIGSMIYNIATGIEILARKQVPYYNKEGKIEKYIDLDDDAISNAANTAVSVVTGIAEGLMKAAGTFTSGSLRDPAKVFGGMIENMSKIGDLIGNAGKAIQQLAIMSIPTKIDPKTGEAKDFVKIKDTDFENAKTNMGKIIDTLFTIFDKEYAKYEKSASNITAGAKLIPSMFNDVLTAASNLGNHWTKNQDGVKVFNDSFNVVVSDGISTNLLCVYDALANNFTRIIKLFFSRNQIYDNKHISFFEVLTKIKKQDEDDAGKIGALTTLINNILIATQSIGKLSTEFNNTFNEKNNIGTFITNFNKFFGHNENDENKSLLQYILETTAYISNKLELISIDKMSTLITIITDFDQIAVNIGIIGNKLADISKITGLNSNSDAIQMQIMSKSIFAHIFGEAKTVTLSVVKNIPEITNSLLYVYEMISHFELNKIITMKSTIASCINIIESFNLIGILLGFISKLKIDTIESKSTGIIFKSKDKHEVKNISLILSSITLIYESLNKIFGKTTTGESINNISENIAKIQTIFKNIGSLFANLTTINNSAFDVSNNTNSVFDILISNISTMYQKLTSIPNVNPETSFTITLLSWDSNKLYNIATQFKRIAEIYEGQSSIEENFNKFAAHVIIVSEYLGKITTTDADNLQSETNSLNKYVKSINSLQPDKADKLINMVDSMNQLSSNIGKLDKFAKHLVNDFGEVVIKLTDQVTEAKETLIEVDKREEERKKRLNDYISKINEIMNGKLIVEVTQGTSESTEGGLGGSPYGTDPAANIVDKDLGISPAQYGEREGDNFIEPGSTTEHHHTSGQPSLTDISASRLQFANQLINAMSNKLKINNKNQIVRR